MEVILSPTPATLRHAAAAGLRLRLDDDGRAQLYGPRSAGPIATALLDAHRDVLADWLTTGRPILDWRDPDHLSRSHSPCRSCRTLTATVDDDGKYMHKVCAEREVADALATLTAPATAQREAS